MSKKTRSRGGHFLESVTVYLERLASKHLLSPCRPSPCGAKAALSSTYLLWKGSFSFFSFERTRLNLKTPTQSMSSVRHHEEARSGCSVRLIIIRGTFSPSHTGFWTANLLRLIPWLLVSQADAERNPPLGPPPPSPLSAGSNLAVFALSNVSSHASAHQKQLQHD